MARIHLSKADISAVEERYVLRALRSGWVAPAGPDIDAFEAEVAQRCGTAAAVALTSGTAALHLALLESGARSGTAVVVPTMTFAATANAVVHTGATPVFVDALAEDGNVNPQMMVTAIDALRREGTAVVAAVSVDLFGRCADYEQIERLLSERDVPLLADAAEAIGASHRGRPAGSFGRAAVLSFNGNKIMTTSGGGMLVSDDERLIERCRYLSTQARQPAAYYEHTEVGYNYRLSNILAALGRAQLSRLDAMIARRREIREMYAVELGEIDGIRLLGRASPGGDAEDNCWLTCIALEPGSVSISADVLLKTLADQDIEARHLWKPMHLQPVFARSRAFTDGTAAALFESGIALPSGSGLTDSEIERVIAAVRAAIGLAR